MQRFMPLTIVFALAAPAPVLAAVNLAGAAATAEYRFPNLGTPYNQATFTPAAFTIGAGTETVGDIEGVTTISADFGNANLGLVFNTVLNNPTWTATGFNGLVFTSAAFSGISSITVLPSSTFAGFDAGRASIVGNELRLNFGGLGYVDGTRLDLTFAGGVPEPASWAMLITGFGLTGAALRRRRLAATA